MYIYIYILCVESFLSVRGTKYQEFSNMMIRHGTGCYVLNEKSLQAISNLISTYGQRTPETQKKMRTKKEGKTERRERKRVGLPIRIRNVGLVNRKRTGRHLPGVV